MLREEAKMKGDETKERTATAFGAFHHGRPSSGRGPRCFKCNASGHKQWNCPLGQQQGQQEQAQCGNCGMRNHKTEECRKPKQGGTNGRSVSFMATNTSDQGWEPVEQNVCF